MKEQYNVIKREAVGVFDNYEQLHETIKDLETSGFGRRQISVRGSDKAVAHHYGATNVDPMQLEDDPEAPRSPLIGPEELGVAQGVLIGACMYLGASLAFFNLPEQDSSGSVAIAVAATALGGLIGAFLANRLGHWYGKFFRKQEEKGGLVLWVETPDSTTIQKAQDIFQRHGAHDIHIHDMPIAA